MLKTHADQGSGDPSICCVSTTIAVDPIIFQYSLNLIFSDMGTSYLMTHQKYMITRVTFSVLGRRITNFYASLCVLQRLVS